MKPARVPIADLPATLRLRAPLETCEPCGAKIFWTIRSDRNEIFTPLYPEPKDGGNMVILGFTRDASGNALPLVADIRHTDEVPDWDAMPEWTRRKRWLHHAPECSVGRRKGLRRM